jgi:5-oxoprolinase (ATP-hydrolysing)/N-methylhydantoinase A
MFEQRTPILVERKELIPDTGGPGAQRGGLGQRLELRKLYDDDLPVLVNVLPHGMGASMTGLLGGLPGGRATFAASGAIVAGTTSDATLVELRDPRQSIVVEASGGSGFGDPRRRSREAIAEDLAEGYVTPDGLALYGATITPAGEIRRSGAVRGARRKVRRVPTRSRTARASQGRNSR